MREYVFRVPDDAVVGVFYDRPEAPTELVRCRDCKYYAHHEWIIATDVEHVCHFWNGEPTKVAPDGFCAWGERREDR